MFLSTRYILDTKYRNFLSWKISLSIRLWRTSKKFSRWKLNLFSKTCCLLDLLLFFYNTNECNFSVACIGCVCNLKFWEQLASKILVFFFSVYWCLFYPSWFIFTFTSSTPKSKDLPEIKISVPSQLQTFLYETIFMLFIFPCFLAKGEWAPHWDGKKQSQCCLSINCFDNLWESMQDMAS